MAAVSAPLLRTVNQRVAEVPTVPKSAGRESLPQPSQSDTTSSALVARAPLTSRVAWALLPAPSAYVRVTLPPPVAAPENVTTTLHEAPTASVPLQVPPAPGKLPPPAHENGAANAAPASDDAALLPEFQT